MRSDAAEKSSSTEDERENNKWPAQRSSCLSTGLCRCPGRR